MCPIVTNFPAFPPSPGLRSAPLPLSCCPLRDGVPKISAQSKRGEQNRQGLSMFSHPVPEPPENRDLAHPSGGKSQNLFCQGLWMKLNLSNMSMLPWDQKEPEGSLLADAVPEGWVPATSAVCDTPTLVWATGLCWCFDSPASPHTNILQVWSFEVWEKLLCSLSVGPRALLFFSWGTPYSNKNLKWQLKWSHLAEEDRDLHWTLPNKTS